MCGGNETVTALFFSLQSSTMLSFILLSSLYSFFYLSFILLSSIKYMSGADGGGPGMGVVALERNGVSFVGSKAKKQQLLAGSGRGVLPLPLMVWIDILPTSPSRTALNVWEELINVLRKDGADPATTFVHRKKVQHAREEHMRCVPRALPRTRAPPSLTLLHLLHGVGFHSAATTSTVRRRLPWHGIGLPRGRCLDDDQYC
jgi:hypothetical protein